MSGAFREGKTVTKINSGLNYFWPCFFVNKKSKIELLNK